MKKIIAVFGAFLFGLLACEDTRRSSIPDYPVFLELTLNLDGQALLVQSGSVYFTERRHEREALGFGGIIVYHSAFENGRFYAYDMACPNEVSRTVRVYPNMINAVCEKCGSVFSLETGNCIDGVAPEGLKIYDAVASYGAAGTTVRVFNQNR